MKLNIISFLLVIFILVGCSQVKDDKMSVELVKCVDGDTAWFKLEDEVIKARFLAIDTPEVDKEEFYAKEALEYTCNLLSNSNITLEYDEKGDFQDKFHRHLVWVFVDDTLLQSLIVEHGYGKIAYVYEDYKYISLLNTLQAKAKKNHVGIWQK